IGAWFEKLDKKAAMDMLVNQDVVAGPVLNIEDILTHPQYIARENLIRIPDEEIGEIVMQGVVPKFSDTPGNVRHAGKRTGADNREVYVRKLGLGDDDLARLEREQVI